MENEVEERLAILELTARYADCADQKDWSALTSLFLATPSSTPKPSTGPPTTGPPKYLHFDETCRWRPAIIPPGCTRTSKVTIRPGPGSKMLVLFTPGHFHRRLRLGTERDRRLVADRPPDHARGWPQRPLRSLKVRGA